MNSKKVSPLAQDLNKEELVLRVTQLEAHVTQLKNILAKHVHGDQNGKRRKGGDGETEEGGGGGGGGANSKSKRRKEFDFKKYNKRHVLLKVCYLGWDYQGLAVQEDTAMTIEKELFDALLKTRLIESRETSNYHRCGRTDKGVSAFGQVISIDLRSNMLDGEGVIVPEGSIAHKRQSGSEVETEKKEKEDEIRYAHILNCVLPPEIKILAWAPVLPKFSARFDCVKRTYKYYFPRGDLDIDLMRKAGELFVGCHDFRNFCKMDVGNGVVNYVRVIHSLLIEPAASVCVDTSDDLDSGYRMFELTVVGQSFLWHQIRCIVAVLFLVGQRNESPDVVVRLLDVENTPCKPQYCMAADLPLVLFECEYENVSWIYDQEAHVSLKKNLQEVWTRHQIRATMIMEMLSNLESGCVFDKNESDKLRHQSRSLIQGCKSKVYKPLFSRPVCESLEDRLKHFKKRRKLMDKKDESKCEAE